MTYEKEMEELEYKVDQLLCQRIKSSLELLSGKNEYEKKIRKALMRTHDWFALPSERLIKDEF